SLALEDATVRALDGTAPVPGVEPIVLGRRPVARRTRVLHGQPGLLQLRDPSVGANGALHQLAVGREVLVADPQEVSSSNASKRLDAGRGDSFRVRTNPRVCTARSQAGQRAGPHRGGEAGSHSNPKQIAAG